MTQQIEPAGLPVAKAKRVMASAADTSATQPWRLKMHGNVRESLARNRRSGDRPG